MENCLDNWRSFVPLKVEDKQRNGVRLSDMAKKMFRPRMVPLAPLQNAVKILCFLPLKMHLKLGSMAKKGEMPKLVINLQQP